MQQGQELLQKWDAHARRLYPRMEITGEGLTLGAGTVLAGMAKDEQGRPRLALRDEPRALALLATAYEQPVKLYILAKLRRACELWDEGEKVSPTSIWPMRICRPAMKNGRCVSSWRTSLLKPG